MIDLKVIVVGLLGLVLGAYLNYRVNEISNNELLAGIKAQLDQYMNKAKTTRLSPEEQQKVAILQAQMDILTKK